MLSRLESNELLNIATTKQSESYYQYSIGSWIWYKLHLKLRTQEIEFVIHEDNSQWRVCIQWYFANQKPRIPHPIRSFYQSSRNNTIYKWTKIGHKQQNKQFKTQIIIAIHNCSINHITFVSYWIELILLLHPVHI